MGLQSANARAGSISVGLLILRLGMGVLCIPHGYQKLLAAIPLVINFLVACFWASKTGPFGDGEHVALYAVGFLALVFTGAGRFSADGMFRK